MTTTDPRLPAPRDPAAYRIALVCLGNICRSPMAHVVLEALLEDAGLGGRVQVRSAGTGDWHVGGAMDPRAAATLAAAGHDPSRHRAQQVAPDWLDPRAAAADDLVLAMDGSNLADLRALAPGADPERVRLFRDFDPVEPGGGVPDPYYGGDDGFREVLGMVERTSASIVTLLRRELGTAPDGDPGRP